MLWSFDFDRQISKYQNKRKVTQVKNIVSFPHTTENACIKRKEPTFSIKGIGNLFTKLCFHPCSCMKTGTLVIPVLIIISLGVAFVHKHLNVKTKEANFRVYWHGCFWHSCPSGLNCEECTVYTTRLFFTGSELMLSFFMDVMISQQIGHLHLPVFLLK